nr:uncharacterized protein LOC111413358 isoform X2 [Onthophagus taurus]
MSDKKVSKIPKLSPIRRASPLIDELHLENMVYAPNQPRIFETKNLNSTCSFLQQLKTKLKNDVDRPSEDDSSEKNALRKISGIVSSILNTLNDVSDDLPSCNSENIKEVTGEMVKVNKTSSLLSDSGKCYYMAQQLTVSHLHETDIDNKPIVDKQFLQQLTNLQAILQETIKKLEDKSTLTQEGKFNEKELNKSFKNRGLASLVQIDHECKPIQNMIKDYSTKSEDLENITEELKKQYLNCSSGELTSQDLSDYDDYPLEYKCCIYEDEEELKKYSKQRERIIPPPKSFKNQMEKKISASKNLTTKNLTTKNLTPKNITPKNLSPKIMTPKDSTPKNLSPTDMTPKDRTPRNSTPKDLTPKNLTPRNSTLHNFTTRALSPINITPKNLSPSDRTPKDITPKNSTAQNFTTRALSPINITPKNLSQKKMSPKNSSSSSPSKYVSLKSDSFKELDESNDKFKENPNNEIKNQDKNEKIMKDVDEKKKDKKNEKRMSSMWAFKSLKRSSDRKVEDDDQRKKCVDKGRTMKIKDSDVQKKSIPEEFKTKKENVKEKDSDNKSHKERKLKKRKVDEKLIKKESNSVGSGDLSKKSSCKTVRIQDNSNNDDNVLIPPPPLFDHDSYVDVEPYKGDSFLSLLKLPGELGKEQINSNASNEMGSQELQRSYTPEKKKSSVQFVTPTLEAYSNLIDELTSTADSFTSSAIQTTGSQLLMNSKSIQDNYISFCSNQSAGSSNVFNSSVEQGINSNVVQMHYSVQASPTLQENIPFESTSTNTPGKSLEQISLKSRSVSVVMPKTQSQVVQAMYETPIFLMPLIETTNEATSASTSLTEAKIPTEDRPSSANSSKHLISKKTSFKSIDPNIAKLRCSNCMCTEGGPSIEKKSSKESVVQEEIGKKLEEVEIFDKDSPQRYFNQVLNEIDMMKNCIEFAMDNQLSIHDKLKAYLDDGRIVKSKYPHFHTSIDGIPVILIWNDDPQSLANHLEIKRLDNKSSDKKLPDKRKPPVKKVSSAKTKKFLPGSSHEKPPSSVGDNTFFFEKKRSMLKTRLLLDHLASAVAKCSKLRKKERFKCDECGIRCPDRFKPAERTKCKISSSNAHIRVKSSCLNFRKKEINVVIPPVQDSNSQKKKSIFINTNSGVLGCRCDSEKSYSDNAGSPIKTIIKTNSSPKCKAKKRCPFKHLGDDKSVNARQPRPKKIEKHETTNIPSKTEAKSIQTYYLTPRLPQKKLKKSPQSSVSDDSVNDIPYLIDAKSLPQFEHPETVCSSKLFDVKQVDCELRNEIKTENQIVKDTLLRINLNALLDSFRPAKCCQKTVLNGKSRGMYPYPASLRSLPLSEEDLDRILQIIQSKKSKRFDTTKRLYESDKFNSFQTANDPIINQTRRETTRTLVYFFELFKKVECKTSLATTPSSSSSSSSRTIIRPTQIRHDLKIFEFIKRIYNNSHPVSDKRVLKRKKDSTKTLYRHRSKHRRHHHHHHHHHHYKRRIQKSTSTSMDKISNKSNNKTSNRSTCSKTTSVVSSTSHSKPTRNISFLLIPKSELNNYFCGELSSMYSPSLNSLPFDDSDLVVQSQIEKDLSKKSVNKEEIDDAEINEVYDDVDGDIRDNIDDDISDDIEESLLMKVDYGRTLGAIYETDESEKEIFSNTDLRKENPCSISEYSLQDVQESKLTTNLEVLTCKLSSSFNQSKDLLGDLKSSQDFELPSTSSSLSTNFPEIPLQRKSLESDLSGRKHNIFSSSSLLSNQSSSRIPISCIPLNCSITKDKPSFLHIPNIINDTKRFLYRQKEEMFKPNLDKIVEKTSDTTSTITSSSPRRRRKSLKRSHCSLSLKSSVSMIGKQTSTSDGLKLEAIPSDEEIINKPYEIPINFEKTPRNEIKSKRTMRIDKAVVAYDISPSCQFTFLSGDTTKLKIKENKFKSENICVWPVFQNRCTKKRNRAFVVAIHSSAVRIGKKEPNQLGDQPNIHGDFCEICRKKTKLSSDSFLLGYIGEEFKSKFENQKPLSRSSSKGDNKKETKEKDNKDTIKKIEPKLKPPEKHNSLKDSFKNDKGNKLEKKKSTTKKEVSHPVKIRTKMLKRRPSIKILPEVIDIKVPTHVKSTRLRHTFCDKGDRPGYVTVLSTPCNCPDVTIFIPCYCSCCDGKPSGHKTNSNYTMVPIIEKN